MAKIVEDVIVIKFSSLVKDGAADQTTCITEEIQAALEQVAQELVGENVIVEVVQHNEPIYYTYSVTTDSLSKSRKRSTIYSCG